MQDILVLQKSGIHGDMNHRHRLARRTCNRHKFPVGVVKARKPPINWKLRVIPRLSIRITRPLSSNGHLFKDCRSRVIALQKTPDKQIANPLASVRPRLGFVLILAEYP